MNWLGFSNVRWIIGITLLFMVAAFVLRNSGVHEIRRDRESVNFAVVDHNPADGDWPVWQGANQTNSFPMESLSLQSSEGISNAWVANVRGHGRVAMCISGEQVFLPTFDLARESVSMQCLDRAGGRLMWQTELHRGGSMPSHPRSAQASTIPACDGKHVFLGYPINGSLVVSALDLKGRIVWQRETGPYYSKWGYSSSPAIYKSLVIVAADNKGARINRLMGSSYLAAMHRHSGEIVWRIHRPGADSFGTPVIATIAGRPQLVVAGRGKVCAYDPVTGDRLWTCDWSADRVSNSVAFDNNHVYATTRQPRPELICIRADGAGDVTRTHVAWRSYKSASDVPSPVVCDGRLYTATDDGLLTGIDAATGKTLWNRRLNGNVVGSPVIIGQSLVCCTEEGTLFVVRLAGNGELVAEIPIGEGILASPVASREQMFLRTVMGLHCIGSTTAETVVNLPDKAGRRL